MQFVVSVIRQIELDIFDCSHPAEAHCERIRMSINVGWIEERNPT